jgi:hypothetical protein
MLAPRVCIYKTRCVRAAKLCRKPCRKGGKAVPLCAALSLVAASSWFKAVAPSLVSFAHEKVMLYEFKQVTNASDHVIQLLVRKISHLHQD